MGERGPCPLQVAQVGAGTAAPPVAGAVVGPGPPAIAGAGGQAVGVARTLAPAPGRLGAAGAHGPGRPPCGARRRCARRCLLGPATGPSGGAPTPQGGHCGARSRRVTSRWSASVLAPPTPRPRPRPAAMSGVRPIAQGCLPGCRREAGAGDGTGCTTPAPPAAQPLWSAPGRWRWAGWGSPPGPRLPQGSCRRRR